jgi:hypothetical protein
MLKAVIVTATSSKERAVFIAALFYCQYRSYGLLLTRYDKSSCRDPGIIIEKK